MQATAYVLMPLSPEEAPDGHCAVVIPFEGMESVAADLTNPAGISLPDPLVFTAYFELMDDEAADFPTNDKRWPLMSDRMLAVIRSLGPVDVGTRRAWLVDDLILDPREPFDDSGAPIPGKVRTNYSVIESVPEVDLIDWERTVYGPDDLFPDDYYEIEELVLKKPETLPSIFRIRGVELSLFVSSACRTACLREELKGMYFSPAEFLFPSVKKRFAPQ